MKKMIYCVMFALLSMLMPMHTLYALCNASDSVLYPLVLTSLAAEGAVYVELNKYEVCVGCEVVFSSVVVGYDSGSGGYTFGCYFEIDDANVKNDANVLYGTKVEASETWYAPGRHTVKLGATDENHGGCADSYTWDITVVEITNVTSDLDVQCQKHDITFTVETDPPDHYAIVLWEGGDNPSGQSGGETYTTQWYAASNVESDKVVRATCVAGPDCIGNYKEKEVTIVGFEGILLTDEDGNSGIYHCYGGGSGGIVSMEQKKPIGMFDSGAFKMKWKIIEVYSENSDNLVSLVGMDVGYEKEEDVFEFTTSQDCGKGYFVVEASVVSDKIPIEECATETIRIHVGCDSCANCQSLGGSSSSVSGSSQSIDPSIAVGELHQTFGLGKTRNGKSAGSLDIHIVKPSPSMYTSALLAPPVARTGVGEYIAKIWGGPSDGEERVDDENSMRTKYVFADDTPTILKQLLMPEGLVDIHVVDQHKYEIRFFDAKDVGARNDDGFYTTLENTSEKVKYTIENPDALPSICNKLKITEARGENEYVTEYEYTEEQSGAHQWKLKTGNDERIETERVVWDGTYTNKVQTVMDGSSNIVSQVFQKYKAFPWGQEIVESVVEVDVGETPVYDPLRTFWTYYENPGDSARYSRLKMVENSDGSWVKYDYNTTGLKSAVISSYKDVGTNATANQARAIYYDYTRHPGETMGVEPYSPRTVVETILGVTNSLTYYAYTQNAAGDREEITERCLTASAAYGDTGNLRTIITKYPSDHTNALYRSKVKSVEHPSGRFESYTYEAGVYVANTNSTLFTFTENSMGEYTRVSVTNGTTSNVAGVALKTTKSVSIKDFFGRVVQTEAYVYTDPEYELIGWAVNTLDSSGRVARSDRSNGTYVENVWGCCGKEQEVNEQGIVMTYSYDDLKRMDITTKEAADDIVTSSVLDAQGRRLSSTVSSDGLALITTNSYNIAGRLTSSIDAAGIQTIYQYSPNGLTSTVIRAGLTNTTVNYVEGRTKYTQQNGVIQSWNDYGINSDGTKWSITYTGPDGTNSPVWSKNVTDLLGRTIYSARPGFGGVILTNQNFYNSIGQMVKTTTPGAAATLYEYDELGNQIRSGLDINNNGVLDLAGPDKITESDSYYEQDASNDWFRVSVSMLYASTNSTPLTNSIQRTRLTGLSTDLTSETVLIDMLGNQTTSYSTIDRANKVRVSLVDTPDSTNAAVSVTVNGLLTSSTTKTGLAYSYTYDALERRTGTTDPRTGTSITHYNDKGQVDWTQDSATNYTYFAYNPNTGRQIAVTNALGKVTRYKFNNEGQMTKTWGDTIYPVSYTFDNYNRMATMTTYRGGIGWNGETWPTNTGTGDTTQWLYNETTGLLTNKLYASTHGTTYTYTPQGKLQTRTWARGITTTYSYDSCCGALTNISYGQDPSCPPTPPITFTFNRLGQQKTITDAQGTRTFAYNDKLQLVSETIVADGVTNVITRSFDTIGRSSGLSLNDNYSVLYGFDNVGRFSSLTATNVGALVSSVQYSYLPNSGLISGWTNSVGNMLVTRSYEANRNLITEVKNTSGINLISQYTYSNDELGRRTQRIDSMSTATTTNDFGYNPRSELANATIGTNQYGFVFDNIGNRESYTNNSETITYLANALNQYANITDGVTNTPTYDSDGNMLTHNGWTYSWNGENRMIEASNASHVITYFYDFKGRMFEKVVDGETNNLSWDGMNIIAESSNSQTNYNVWGLDLSGSLQGAGGIGGLLATIQDGETYFTAFDANGNITEYVSTNGTAVAHREYSPFGQTIALTGTKKDDFTHWFSTKPWDAITGMSEYELRKYLVEVGRWPSRDPIGTKGGINLFVFVVNDPVRKWDAKGLFWQSLFGCCDRCKAGDSPALTGVTVSFKHANAQFPPGAGAAGIDILGDAALVGHISAVGGVLASGGVAAPMVLAAMDWLIGENMTAGWTDKIVGAIGEIGNILMESKGVAIWVQVEWKECKTEKCFRWYRLNWKEFSKWRKCEGALISPNEGIPYKDKAAIGKALPGCVKEVVSNVMSK